MAKSKVTGRNLHVKKSASPSHVLVPQEVLVSDTDTGLNETVGRKQSSAIKASSKKAISGNDIVKKQSRVGSQPSGSTGSTGHPPLPPKRSAAKTSSLTARNTSARMRIDSQLATPQNSAATDHRKQADPGTARPAENRNAQDQRTAAQDSSTSKENKTNSMTGLGDLIGSASNIVMKAAGILEVEIARGILAAKQVEEKYSNVPRIRSGEIINNRQFDDLFVRFRKDAHDILDLIVDFAGIAAQGASKVGSRLIKVTTGKTQTAPASESQQVPMIQVPGELKAGQQITFPVTLENDHATETKTVLFVNSPLTDSAGNQLPQSTLNFNPNPLKLLPSSTASVVVSVNIPGDAKPGNYTCFVQAHNSESLKANLMVKVV